MNNENDHPLLRLVGGQRVLARNGDFEEMYQFYTELLSRLTKEVRHIGELSRYVGYECTVSQNKNLHFFGIEVPLIETIPAGMVAWDLTDTNWHIWRRKDNKDTRIWNSQITWRWSALCMTDNSGYLGEFSGRIPSDLWGESPLPKGDYCLSANSHISPKAPSSNHDDVHVCDYDPSWPAKFEASENWLRKTFDPDIIMRVVHYGSTAIPGMPAKPIIDILVEIPDFTRAKSAILPRLNRSNWEYWWYDEHMILIRRDGMAGPRTHHYHLAPGNHRMWDRVAFKDYLIDHPADAKRYADLKKKLSERHRQDRERYTRAKTEFVTEIISKALE